MMKAMAVAPTWPENGTRTVVPPRLFIVTCSVLRLYRFKLFVYYNYDILIVIVLCHRIWFGRATAQMSIFFIIGEKSTDIALYWPTPHPDLWSALTHMFLRMMAGCISWTQLTISQFRDRIYFVLDHISLMPLARTAMQPFLHRILNWYHLSTRREIMMFLNSIDSWQFHEFLAILILGHSRCP